MVLVFGLVVIGMRMIKISHVVPTKLCGSEKKVVAGSNQQKIPQRLGIHIMPLLSGKAEWPE